MKYTKDQLIKLTESATSIETYKYQFSNGNIHTDNVEYIGNGSFDKSEIDNLAYDESGEVDVDVEIMDADRYSNTILANSSVSIEEGNDPTDTIAVIVVRK